MQLLCQLDVDPVAQGFAVSVDNDSIEKRQRIAATTANRGKQWPLPQSLAYDLHLFLLERRVRER